MKSSLSESELSRQSGPWQKFLRGDYFVSACFCCRIAGPEAAQSNHLLTAE
jgi:hypothetical protein